MKTQGTYRARTYKEVTIEHNFDEHSVSDDVLVGWAMREVGESPESLFGWNVKRPVQHGHLAIVTLYTD